MNSAVDENSWRTQVFRSNVVQRIEETIQKCGMPTTKTSVQMENHVYQKAKTKDEYLSFVARLILHVKEMDSNKKNQMPVQQPHSVASVGPHTQNSIPSQPSPADMSWRTQAFRNNVIQKIEEAILNSGVPTTKTSVEMENHVYQKAKTKDEYVSYATRIILHIKERQQPQSMGIPFNQPKIPIIMLVSGEMMTPGLGNLQNASYIPSTSGLANLPNAAHIQSPFQVPNQFIGQNTPPPQSSPIDTSWKTQAFRSNVIQKIEEAIQKSGMPMSETSVEMENHIYQKAKTKDEYSSYVTRLISLFIDSNENNQMSGQQPQEPPTQDLIRELMSYPETWDADD